MVAEAVEVLETVADDGWAVWAGRLVPNIVRRVREEAEEKAREEEQDRVRREAEAKARRAQEEAEVAAREEAERELRRQRRMDEKLDAFLANEITESELERDSDEAGEVEQNEATGKEEVDDLVGTEISAMEIDDAGEDEVMVVDEAHPSGGRKRAPSSPPKPSNKRARAATAIQGNVGRQLSKGTDAKVSASCERCVRQGIACVPTGGGARCANCKAKHLGCSLVIARELSEVKGSASGLPGPKAAGGSRPKRQPKAKKEPVPKGGLAGVTSGA